MTTTDTASTTSIPSVDELLATPQVQRWLEGPGLVDLPQEEKRARVNVLAQYAAHRGRAPLSELEEVLKPSEDDGQYTISIKGRRGLDMAIDAFADTLGLGQHQAITTGNVVRGFFIHNGVMLQGRPSL